MPRRGNDSRSLPATTDTRGVPILSDADSPGEEKTAFQVTRHLTITWGADRGGWLGRIVFGVLGAVLLIAVALVSIVVLLWLVLGILAVLAIALWKTRLQGQGTSWTILRGKRQRR